MRGDCGEGERGKKRGVGKGKVRRGHGRGEGGGKTSGRGEGENEGEDIGEGKGRRSRVISWWRRGRKAHKIDDFTHSAKEHGSEL